MRYRSLAVFCVIFLSLQSSVEAQSASGRVRCPFITITGSGQYFPRSSNQFRCYATERSARRAGLLKAQGSTVVSVGAPPTASIVTFSATPTPLPQQSFSFSGTGGGASGVFIVRALPAVVTYTHQGGSSETFSLLLRDSSTGFLRSQLAYGRGVATNAAVISKTGVYYLEVKAGQNMNWGVTVTHN